MRSIGSGDESSEDALACVRKSLLKPGSAKLSVLVLLDKVLAKIGEFECHHAASPLPDDARFDEPLAVLRDLRR